MKNLCLMMGLYIAPMLSKPDMVKPVNPTGGRWHMLEIQHDTGACSATSALEKAYGATSAASRCQVKLARYWSGYAMLSTSFHLVTCFNWRQRALPGVAYKIIRRITKLRTFHTSDRSFIRQNAEMRPRH